jgi:tetratricopeptide (TPR) repeat protein
MSAHAPTISAIRALLASGNMAAAAMGASQLIEMEGESTELQFLLGRSLAVDRPERAADALKRALDLDPSALDARLLFLRLATTYGDAGYMADAAREAIAAAPGAARVLDLAAKALFKSKNYPEAVQAWDQVATLKPGDAAPRLNIARALEREFRYEDAADAAVDALRIEPANVTARVIAAEFLHRAKRLGEFAAVVRELAEYDLPAALAFVPLMTPEQLSLSVDLLQRGLTRTGIPVEQTTVDAVVNQLLTLARDAIDAGNHAESAMHFRAILRLVPNHPKAVKGVRKCIGALYDAGDQLCLEQRYAEAVRAFRTLVEIDGTEIGGLWKLANALERAGAPDEALGIWRDLLAVSDDGRLTARFIRAIGLVPPAAPILEMMIELRSRFPESQEFERRGESVALKLTKAEIEALRPSGLVAALTTLELVQRWRPDGEAVRRLIQALRRQFVELAKAGFVEPMPAAEAEVPIASDLSAAWHRFLDAVSLVEDWARLVHDLHKHLGPAAQLKLFSRARANGLDMAILAPLVEPAVRKLSRDARACAERGDFEVALTAREILAEWLPGEELGRRLAHSLRRRLIATVRGNRAGTPEQATDDPAGPTAIKAAWQRLEALAESREDWAELVDEAYKWLEPKARLGILARARCHLGNDEAFVRRGAATAHKLSRAALAMADAGELETALEALEAIRAWEPEGELCAWLSHRLAKPIAVRFRESVEGGTAEETLLLAQRLREIDPENPAAIQWIADHQFRRGDFGDALEAYERLLALGPGRPSLLRKLDKCLAEVNRSAAA